MNRQSFGRTRLQKQKANSQAADRANGNMTIDNIEAEKGDDIARLNNIY